MNMAGKEKKSQPPAGNPSDPLGMAVLLERFLEHLRVKNYSERTVDNNQTNLTFFIQWAAERSITRPNEVTKPIVERYQRHLYHCVKKDGKPLSFRSQHMKLVAIRTWFKWLTRSNHLLYNPASEIDLPKLGTRLPKHVMSIREAESVLAQANIDDPLGLRDRAIMETLYSTGIRRLELIGLSVYDLEVERGTLMIRQGKGKKDRVVPIGERAITWIERYTREVRPTIIVNPNDATLFLTHLGEPFSTSRLTSMVREYVQKAAIGKKGSCHMFRHTMATLMLENGADVRFIQAMLGHSKLETTQIYTQVSIRKLKEVHDLTHPAKSRRETGGERPEEESGSS
jgi:integrase/recombinase XerD